MKNGWVILAAAGLAFAGARTGWTAEEPEKTDARGEFARGEKAYEAGDHAAAAAAFWAAAEGASAEGLDADAARFNALVAAEAAGEAGREVAERVLGAAETTPDVELQAQLHFNRGNAWMKRAEEAEAGAAEALQAAAGAAAGGNGGAAPAAAGPGAMECAERAVAEYREAVLRDVENVAYKQNYELGVKRLEELKQAEAQRQQEGQQDGDDPNGQREGQQPQPEEDGSDGSPPQEREEAGERQDGSRDDASQDDDARSAGAEGEESEEAGEARPRPDGEEMTEEEAARLMDAMKEREEGQRDGLRVILGRPVPVEKDW